MIFCKSHDIRSELLQDCNCKFEHLKENSAARELLEDRTATMDGNWRRIHHMDLRMSVRQTDGRTDGRTETNKINVNKLLNYIPNSTIHIENNFFT